ncbi:MAG TPA: hypothetical protein VMW14_00705 [Candidatus Paceibacterota bacterium]|nr:hypothetical protein [Candidatus Paceibacterota bacterium]
MKKLLSLLIILLLIPLFSARGTEESDDAQRLNSSITHVFPLNVVFVGFKQEVVDTATIDLTIGKDHSFDYGAYTVHYNFNLSYYFADSSYYSAVKTLLLANSVNGTDLTSRLNVTALELQKTTGTRTSIFLPQSGRAINATAVEDWFASHPYAPDQDPAYWFYVMNFTEFDSADHSLEHWYNTTELDFEANRLRDFWRLEWDNSLNPDVKFPYACFTSQTRVVLIDPSAFQWYLTWARIWWGLSVSGPKGDYYFEDLDQFLATHNVNTSQGKTDLAYYLAGWVDDMLANLLAPSLWTSIEASEAKSLSIQALILNNVSDSGYTNEAMSWIINSTLAREAIEDLAPFIDVEVTVEFHELASYPQLEAIFDNAVIEKRDGWTYYDGAQVWSALSDVRDAYFNLSAADIVINGYVFLERNMSMIYSGGEYTGLGGGGQILVMKEVGRYFQADGVSPKSGLGLVFIHEAGHNLGFPHTFRFWGFPSFAGDFAFDVMGYYPYSFYFTQLRKDCFRRLVVDYRILSLQEKLGEDLALYGRKNSTSVIDTKFDEVYSRINETLQLYEEMQFLEALSSAEETKAAEQGLVELIWVYLCDLNNDGVVNIFDIVLMAGAYGSNSGDPKWNPDADLVQDGEINIFDIVLAAGHYGQHW